MMVVSVTSDQVSLSIMMLNAILYDNNMPDGMGVLEVVEPSCTKRLFVPMKKTEISGNIHGPASSCRITQVFSFQSSSFNHAIEAVYRFPLPGDGVFTGVTLQCENDKITSDLARRDEAEEQYYQAFSSGTTGMMLTRETSDIFTLHVTGIKPDEDISITVSFLLFPKTEGTHEIFRFPLTTIPRFIKDDEIWLPQKNAQPILSLLDPGYSFSVDMTITGYESVMSPSHSFKTSETDDGAIQISLTDGESLPDRDFLLTCTHKCDNTSPFVTCIAAEDPEEKCTYLMATFTPPQINVPMMSREIVILVEHDESIQGLQRKTVDLVAQKLLETIQKDEVFTLGIFNVGSCWVSKHPVPGTEENIRLASEFLTQEQERGYPDLSTALLKAFSIKKIHGVFVRQVILITAARMTDEGRSIKLIREEQGKKDPRSLSVICIDASPNAPFVQEMSRRGKGIARILNPHPEEKILSATVDSITRFWRDSAGSDYFLRINCDYGETADDGVFSGDIPLHRYGPEPVSLLIRVPIGPPLSVDLVENEQQVPIHIERQSSLPIRKIFGATRVKVLEQILTGFYDTKELRLVLTELGYSGSGGKPLPNLSPHLRNKDVYDILTRESLRFQVPSSQTAFFCRKQRGKAKVRATIAIPSILSSSEKISQSSVSHMKFSERPPNPVCMSSVNNVRVPDILKFGENRVKEKLEIRKYKDTGRSDNDDQFEYSAPCDMVSPCFEKSEEIWINRKPDNNGNIYDQISDTEFTIREITGEKIPSAGRVEIFIGDKSTPRAVITVQEFITKVNRKLRIRVGKGKRMRVVVLGMNDQDNDEEIIIILKVVKTIDFFFL